LIYDEQVLIIHHCNDHMLQPDFPMLPSMSYIVPYAKVNVLLTMSAKRKNLPTEASSIQGGLWKEIILSDDAPFPVEIGPLTVYFRKFQNEIWVAYDRAESVDPEKLTWSSWAFDSENFRVHLKPLLPDRMLTVKPETPFRLVKNARIKVHSRVPVWVGIYADGHHKNKLTEIPTVELSNTWFGDVVNGTLSYWLSTRARRQIDREMYNPHTAICTFNIHNASGDELVIEKINLPVERLSLYLHEGQLWSDEMDVAYKGGDQHSEIFMHGKAPSASPQAMYLSHPRNPVKHSLAERIIKGIHLF
jgi:hypothetical protein